jgi:hypothetical protein
MVDPITVNPSDTLGLTALGQQVQAEMVLTRNIEHLFQNALDEVSSFGEKQDLDLMYITSIGFLFIFTIAIVTSLVSYRNLLDQPMKKRNGTPDGQPAGTNNDRMTDPGPR